MAVTWTVDGVASLAPDPSAMTAARGLASVSHWSSLGRSERALWGLCRGSGKEPYQVRVDVSGPAFKCSCPSRKFPCKHALGLLLCRVASEGAFPAHAEPDWVRDWLANREERAQRTPARPADRVPEDPEAAAARLAVRAERVSGGVQECASWLQDLVRRGLGAARTEPAAEWKRVAARMVDAQAPGLGERIEAIADAMASGEGWHERALDRVGRLHLVLEAATRMDTLPPPLAADVRVALGWSRTRTDASFEPARVRDAWCVLGQTTSLRGSLRERRTWLLGARTGRRALLLDFRGGGAPFDLAFVPGSAFEAELAFFVSALRLRAVLESEPSGARGLPTSLGGLAHASCDAALQAVAEDLARVPWLGRSPMFLGDVVPGRAGARRAVMDGAGASLPVELSEAAFWRLVSVSGGRPVHVMGEWDGEALAPLSVMQHTTTGGWALHDLAQRRQSP